MNQLDVVTRPGSDLHRRRDSFDVLIQDFGKSCGKDIKSPTDWATSNCHLFIGGHCESGEQSAGYQYGGQEPRTHPFLLHGIPPLADDENLNFCISELSQYELCILVLSTVAGHAEPLPEHDGSNDSNTNEISIDARFYKDQRRNENGAADD